MTSQRQRTRKSHRLSVRKPITKEKGTPPDTAKDHCPKYTSLSPQLGVWGSLNMAEAKMVKTILRVALDTNLNCIYFYLKVLLTFLFKKKHTKLPEMWTGSTRRGSPLLARAPAVARGTNICETLDRQSASRTRPGLHTAGYAGTQHIQVQLWLPTGRGGGEYGRPSLSIWRLCLMHQLSGSLLSMVSWWCTMQVSC